MATLQYDVIIFGATSFVGQILCKYMADNFNVEGKDALRWAIAGRSKNKLEEVKQHVGLSDIAVHVADANDEAALRDLCIQTRVIVSTVGPYALYGETLVKACAENGTDYCDLTGEVQWIYAMLNKYEQSAKKSGARIVTQQQTKQSHGEYCQNIKMRVKAAKGGASGGTIASMVNITKEAAKDPVLRKQLANPYLICPSEAGYDARQFNTNKPTWDEAFSAWTGPFVMAGINTRIVFRSNALTGSEYGTDFTYDEAMLMGKDWKGCLGASAMVAGLGVFLLGVSLKPSRYLLERYILPKPGAGPSPKEQVEGYYDLRFMGETSTGKTVSTKVTGQGDPGYGSTSKMLGQAAACLALDFYEEEKKIGKDGGFWTPASIFGDKLVGRLIEHADVTFEVL